MIFGTVIEAINPLVTSGPFYGVYLLLKSVAVFVADNSLSIIALIIILSLHVILDIIWNVTIITLPSAPLVDQLTVIPFKMIGRRKEIEHLLARIV